MQNQSTQKLIRDILDSSALTVWLHALPVRYIHKIVCFFVFMNYFPCLTRIITAKVTLSAFYWGEVWFHDRRKEYITSKVLCSFLDAYVSGISLITAHDLWAKPDLLNISTVHHWDNMSYKRQKIWLYHNQLWHYLQEPFIKSSSTSIFHNSFWLLPIEEIISEYN